MKIPYMHLINLFIISPLFIYAGYTIITGKEFNFTFEIIILILGIFLIVRLFRRFIHVISKVSKKERLSKEIGFLFLIIGALIIAFNIYMIFNFYKDRKNS